MYFLRIRPHFRAQKQALAWIIPVIFIACSSYAEMVFTIKPNVKGDNNRNNYQLLLLDLALSKTRPKYGPYRLVDGPKIITTERTHLVLKKNKYENYVRPLVLDKRFTLDKNLSFVPFPIFLGLLSYRVCFVSAHSEERIAQSDSLDQLQQFKQITGPQWIDAQILRFNGFSVVENESYSGIFKVLDKNLVQMFCRGVNEIQEEHQLQKHLVGVKINTTFALHYPLLMVYYMNAKNKAALARIEEGLKIAYQDGSMQSVWERTFRQSLEFSNLPHRKIYKLRNPSYPDDTEQFEAYFYHPTIENQ